MTRCSNTARLNARETPFSVGKPLLDHWRIQWHVPTRHISRWHHTKLGEWFPLKTISQQDSTQPFCEETTRHRPTHGRWHGGRIASIPVLMLPTPWNCTLGEHDIEAPAQNILKEYFETYSVSGKVYRTYGGPNRFFGNISRIVIEYGCMHVDPTNMP